MRVKIAVRLGESKPLKLPIRVSREQAAKLAKKVVSGIVLTPVWILVIPIWLAGRLIEGICRLFDWSIEQWF